MPKESKNISKLVKTPIGNLIHIGDKWEDEKVTYTSYDSKNYNQENLSGLESFFSDKRDTVKWLDVVGLHNTALIKELAEKLNLHPLLVEDVLNTSQNPKLEYYDTNLFIVTKSIYIEEDDDEISTEQISFVLLENTLVTFREFDSKVFDSVTERIKENANIRKNGTSHLLYALLDTIVDDYFLIIEYMGEKIDIVEDELLLNPKNQLLQNIYMLKRELIYIRNSLWPMRNVISTLSRNEDDLIDEPTIYYLRDVYDHIIQIIDIVETYREICSGMLDTYLSSLANKSNEVMKILTVFSTIFIPLTFFSGVYGMNFKYLPELNWKYSYLVFWIISLSTILTMLRYFKKKKWL